MQDGDFISAAIVTYNDREKAVAACRSILENTKKYPLRLYVVDNASSDGSADAAEQLAGVTVLRQGKNLGFGAAHNKLLEQPLGRYHFVVNPDILLQSDLLSDMADFLDESPDIVMAMPRILNADGTEQLLPKEKPTFRRLFLGRLARLGGPFRRVRDEYVRAGREIRDVTDIDFCSGSFFAIRSEAFRTLHGFDERFFMYLEDADLTLRAKRLGRVVLIPAFAVVHLWARASAHNLRCLLLHMRSCLQFLYKWKGM